MRPILFAALLATAFLAPASADHCTTWSTTVPEYTIGVYGTTPVVYVDFIYNPALETWSTWIYEESNGYEGLQHADEEIDDTCHGMIPGDTIVF